MYRNALRSLVLFSGLICLAAQGATSGQKNDVSKPGQPPSPPEVKRTVAAIAGRWSGQMTAKVPGFPAEAFPWTMDCGVVAQGAGASCSNQGKASIGQMAESCLLAYDPESKF